MFTPLNNNRERLEFNDEDVKILAGHTHLRELGLQAVLKIKDKHYLAYGMQCDLEGCNCDMMITELTSGFMRSILLNLDHDCRRNDPEDSCRLCSAIVDMNFEALLNLFNLNFNRIKE